MQLCASVTNSSSCGSERKHGTYASRAGELTRGRPFRRRPDGNTELRKHLAQQLCMAQELNVFRAHILQPQNSMGSCCEIEKSGSGASAPTVSIFTGTSDHSDGPNYSGDMLCSFRASDELLIPLKANRTRCCLAEKNPNQSISCELVPFSPSVSCQVRQTLCDLKHNFADPPAQSIHAAWNMLKT